jgi:hypothetical protein
MFLILFLRDSTDYLFVNYSSNVIVNADAMIDVAEDFTVFFPARAHGMHRTIPIRLPGWAVTDIRISKIKVVGWMLNYTYTERRDYITITMGDPEEYVVGTQRYQLTYRMSPSVYNWLCSINLIGSAWVSPRNNVTFSITYPRPLKIETLHVDYDDNCSYDVVGSTVSGNCSCLSNGGVTSDLKFTSTYFMPTTEQAVFLCVGLGFLVLFLFLVLRFYLQIRPRDSLPYPDIHPVAMAQLLYGSANPQIALLHLASEGIVSLDLDTSGDVSVTELGPRSIEPGIGYCLRRGLMHAKRMSGRCLQTVLYGSRISEEAASFLLEQGYITKRWVMMLSVVIAIGFPHCFVVVEIGNAYETVFHPMIWLFVLASVDWFGAAFFIFNNNVYIRWIPGLWRLAALFMVVLPLVVMGIYWGRPTIWDTAEAMILTGLAVALWVWALQRCTRWTALGIRAVAALRGSRSSILDAPPAAGADPRELWRYAAYVVALDVPAAVSDGRLSDWVDWASEVVVDPDERFS